MITRKIEEEEYLEAVKISTVAFECPSDLPETNEELVKRVKENPQSPAEQYFTERYAAFGDDGKMMASLGVMPFKAYFDGNVVPMNGIGDVSTLPQYRRGGAIRSCFSAALVDMYKNGDVFSYLYPFSYYFYRKFGYEVSAQTVTWKVALRALPKGGSGGRLEMFEPGSDISGFEEAYSTFAKNYNLMLERDEVLWKRRMTGFDPYKTKQWSFLWRDENDVPGGYLIYVSEIKDGKRIMVLRDFGFNSLRALSALLEFLSTFSSQYEYAEIPLPDSVSLDGVICEPAYEQISRKIDYIGMVRVVNVKKALKAAKYKGSGRFVISVTDDTIPKNSGFYAVEFNDGEKKVYITDEEPDIETDIQNFGRLITGACDIDSSVFYSGIKINSNTETLKKAFYKKPLWINDYF